MLPNSKNHKKDERIVICGAVRKKDGEPCRRLAIKGEDFCWQHSRKFQRKFRVTATVIASIAAVSLYTIVLKNVYDINQIFFPTATPTPPLTQESPEELRLEEQMSQIDAILKQTLSASIAYNKPSSMDLEATSTIELLLNPSLSPKALSTQVAEKGQVISTSIQITPRMKALLVASDPTAFTIQQIHDNPEQLVSGTDTTRWAWLITAKKSGMQQLTLIIYRLITYEGQDYWREVETYKADIDVKVNLSQRIQAFDWKWVAGFVLTLLGSILGVLTWQNNRNKKEEKSKEDKPAKSVKKGKK